MTAASALRSVPLFAQLRDSDLGFLTGLLRPRDFAKNRVILFAHDSSDAFYVILSGQVKVMMIAEDGREVVLSLVGQGDFFGETALLDDEPFAASVIAVEDSSLLVLHRDDFRRCIKDTCRRWRSDCSGPYAAGYGADHKIGGLMLLDVTGRIAHLLLDLAARADGDQLLEVPTHQVIAQMVGSSRETVSRTITLLASRGWIETSPDGIRIMNRKELESAAGLPHCADALRLRRLRKSAGPKRQHKRVEHAVRPRSAHLRHLGQRYFVLECRPVCACGRECIVDIDDSNDLRRERNLIAAQPVGISGAIVLLMVPADDRLDVPRKFDIREKFDAPDWVHLDHFELVRGESAGFVQDFVRNLYLADVVKVRAKANRFLFLFIKAERLRNGDCVLGNTLTVTVRVAVRRFD